MTLANPKSFPMTQPVNKLCGSLPKVGIRPCIDGRRKGVREGLEDMTMLLARKVAELISGELFTFDPRGRKISVRADGELNFKVNIKSGWRRGRRFEVTAKGAEIREEEDGSFTIFHVEQNTTVLVSGIVRD